jgi:hypothetical protein
MLETPCCVAIYAGQSFMRPFFNVVNYAGQSFFVALLWPFCGPFPVAPRCGQFCWPIICAALFRSCGLLFQSASMTRGKPATLCLLGIYILHAPKMPSIIISIPKFASHLNYHLPPLIAIWAPRLLGMLHPTQTGGSVDLSQILNLRSCLLGAMDNQSTLQYGGGDPKVLATISIWRHICASNRNVAVFTGSCGPHRAKI